MLTSQLVALALAAALAVRGDEPPDPGPVVLTQRCLHFTNRDRVELKDTKGLLDLNGTFTVEAWVRWDANIRAEHYLMGDEAWPGMSPDIPATVPCGWVLRMSAPDRTGTRKLDFTIGATANGKADWTSVLS